MTRRNPVSQKHEPLQFSGVLLGVQARIRLGRSFDEAHHSYLGYSLRLEGSMGGESGIFVVGIGKAGYYKASKLVVSEREGGSRKPAGSGKGSGSGVADPPWIRGIPTLEVFRERGHRRLSARTYDTSCRACMWGCHMAVEIQVDQWNPTSKRYRTETFCYGPLSCPVYKAGPTRKVPGRRGMTWQEPDWVDEEATAHRGPDE